MKKLLCLIIIGFVLLSGCGGTDPSDDLKKSFTKDSFPVSVGNWWRYRLDDSLTHTTDTILLRVISKVETSGITTFTCNVEVHNQVIDTSYFEISQTQLSYSGKNDYSHFGHFILKLPFQAGDEWGSMYFTDTIRVVSRLDSLSVLDKKYQPVYLLQRSLAAGGYSLNQNLLVSPSIGIIDQTFHEFVSEPVQRKHFQLIDYMLK